jgi:hypothetical protein
VPSENGPFLASSCPYFARFCPRGRDHTYDLCAACGEEPFVPSRTELADLCHGDFTRCPRFQSTRRREEREVREDGEDNHADRRAA